MSLSGDRFKRSRSFRDKDGGKSDKRFGFGGPQNAEEVRVCPVVVFCRMYRIYF